MLRSNLELKVKEKLQIKLIISKENINIKYVDQNICYNSTIFQNITWVSIAMIYYIIYKYTIYKKKKKKHSTISSNY